MKFLYPLLLVFIAISCTPSDIEPRKLELLPFTVTVKERNNNTAIIEWTAGTNDPSAVKYKVMLDGKVIKMDLTRKTDTLINLSANLAYTGSVTVYTQKGDSAFAQFTLPKLSIDPRPLKPFTVTVGSRALYTTIIEWTEASNFYDTEVVKYDVLLQGKVIHSSLTNTRDTLRNINKDSVYSGRVLAYTASGDTASAPFELQKLNGFVIYGVKDQGLFCYDIFNALPVWQYRFGYPSPDDTYGLPTIVDTVLYTNSSSGTSAFNVNTGKRLWRTTLYDRYSTSHPFSSVYQNNILYSVLDKGVYALNATTGQLLWSYDPLIYNLMTHPVVDGNLLFLVMRNLNAPAALGIFSKIIALDIRTGSPVWEKEANYTTSINPAVYNGLLIYGSSNGKIYALNQSDGTLNWSRDFSVGYNNAGADAVSPVIHNNTVIVQNQNQGYFALSAQTGSTLWNYKAFSYTSSPAVGNGLVYFSLNISNKLVAVNLQTGEKVWETNAPNSFVSPIVVKNRLYIITGKVSVYNAINGAWIFDFPILNGVYGHGEATIISDGVPYHPAESGMLP